MVQKIGRGGNERGGEGKEEKEEEEEEEKEEDEEEDEEEDKEDEEDEQEEEDEKDEEEEEDEAKRREEGGGGGGSLSKISSEETLSKLRLKLNQDKAHPQNTPAGRRISHRGEKKTTLPKTASLCSSCLRHLATFETWNFWRETAFLWRNLDLFKKHNGGSALLGIGIIAFSNRLYPEIVVFFAQGTVGNLCVCIEAQHIWTNNVSWQMPHEDYYVKFQHFPWKGVLLF